MIRFARKSFVRVFDNTIQAFIPEFWANESLAILEENMVIGNLVHRDFENVLQKYGDTVNTRRPGEFKAKRKTNADSVVIQDATATNVPVTLNQHIHVSFMIKDGEESMSMQDLIDTYISPAMIANARFIDRVLLGQVYQFLPYVYGTLGGLSNSNGVDLITGVRNKMNINKAYVMNRNLIITPNTETAFLNNQIFIQANTVGDDGTALAEASLGRKLGFDIFMSQNTPAITTGNTTFADTTSAAYPVGATSIVTVTGGATVFAPGEWFSIAGDGQPLQVLTYTSGTKTVTFTPGLKTAVASGAAISKLTAGQVNLPGSNYAAGYAEEINVKTFTVAPQVGQMVTFGTQATKYSIVDVNGLVSITLDRPLDLQINDNDLVTLGPPGQYNFAFHRNALALVIRPLAAPKAGTGALSSVINVNGLSMRATITYDGRAQGHLVTLDMLAGVAVLDVKLGAVLLG